MAEREGEADASCLTPQGRVKARVARFLYPGSARNNPATREAEY